MPENMTTAPTVPLVMGHTLEETPASHIWPLELWEKKEKSKYGGGR